LELTNNQKEKARAPI